MIIILCLPFFTNPELAPSPKETVINFCTWRQNTKSPNNVLLSVDGPDKSELMTNVQVHFQANTGYCLKPHSPRLLPRWLFMLTCPKKRSEMIRTKDNRIDVWQLAVIVSSSLSNTIFISNAINGNVWSVLAWAYCGVVWCGGR